MLAQTTSLGTLIAVKVRDRKPFKRHIKLTELVCYHTCDGGSHFGTNRKVSASSVGEVVGLLVYDLDSALCGVNVEGFEHGSVVFVECGKLERASDLTEKPVAKAHIGGIKISCALVGLCRKNVSHSKNLFC